jgi:hypothetical protein
MGLMAESYTSPDIQKGSIGVLNGETLLAVPGDGLYCIRLLTRRLMGEQFDEDDDVWEL